MSTWPPAVDALADVVLFGVLIVVAVASIAIFIYALVVWGRVEYLSRGDFEQLVYVDDTATDAAPRENDDDGERATNDVTGRRR